MRHNHSTIRVKTMTMLFLILGLLASCDCMHRTWPCNRFRNRGNPCLRFFYSRDSLLTAEEKQYEYGDSLHLYQLRTDSTGWFMDFRLADGLTCRPPLV